MSTATRTFHARIYLAFYGQSLDFVVGYHIADTGTDKEKIGANIDYVNAPNGEDILYMIDEDTRDLLAHTATERFRDSKNADIYGEEEI